MATIPPGTEVSIISADLARLAFPPPPTALLAVAVHPLALRAPSNHLTQVVATAGGEIMWVGALDEAMLGLSNAVTANPRPLLGERMLIGSHLWEVFRPGPLLVPASQELRTTVYRGDRPWVIIGELLDGSVLAAPLNEPSNPMWWTPVLEASELQFIGSKRSQLELAHVWSFSPPASPIGRVAALDPASLSATVSGYFR